MADSWFYVQNGVRQGPVTLEQLKLNLRAGVISGGDNVWRDGLAAWMPARQVPELASETAPAMASPPPMTHTVYGNPPTTPSAPLPFSAGLRVMMIIGAVLAIGAFFAPYFRTNATFVVDDSLMHVMTANEQAMVKEYQDVNLGTNLFGWDLWFGIVAMALGGAALIFAILDLSLRRVRVMRVINKWMLFVLFAGIFGVSAAGMTLGLFKIGMGVVNPAGLYRPFSGFDEFAIQTRKGAADIRKKIKAEVDAARPEDKAQAEKNAIDQLGDPAMIEKAGWQLSAIPIAAPAAVVGGALGLIGALVVLAKKK